MIIMLVVEREGKLLTVAHLYGRCHQYFSDIISTAGSGVLSAKELNDFKTVHQLVVELNKAAPVLLLNVIPQLEEELKLTDVNIRSLAVSSLGQMFAEKTSQLTNQYESTWKAWLQRYVLNSKNHRS